MIRLQQMLLATLTVAVSIGWQTECAAETKHARVAELRTFFNEYFARFNEGDSAYLAHYVFRSPVVSMDPVRGVTNVYPASKDREELYEQLYITLRKQGWSHSRITELRVQYLAENLAFVRLQFTRHDEDDRLLSNGVRANQLVVLKTAEGWRIPLIYSLPEISGKQTSRIQLAGEVKQAFQEYLNYLNQDRADLVATKIYSYPLMTRSWRESDHGIKLKPEDASERLGGYLLELKQEGLSHFEIYRQRIQVLAPTYALVHLESSRIRKDGVAIPPARTKFSYVWVKTGESWKLVGVFGHPVKQ